VFAVQRPEGNKVRNTFLATAVTAALVMATADASAQSRAEWQAMQAQLEALSQRLNRLEAANNALQAENTDLKAVVERRDAEMDYLKSQTRELREETAVASNEISKVKGADWATRIKLKGDLRYRHEQFSSERVVDDKAEDAADRYRHRIRARLGFEAKPIDDVLVGVQLATGGDDPRSTNQTLGGTGTTKSIGLDLAYVDWNWFAGSHAILGKHKYSFWRPGQSLLYDSDFNPEGGAVTFDRGMFFGGAYGWWITEQYSSNPKGENADTNIFGGQLGLKTPLFGDNLLTAALHYYDCGACKDQSPLYNNSGNGNTTYRVGTDTRNYLEYDYEVLMLSAALAIPIGDLPLTLWADYGQNLASGVEYDTAWGAGVMLGKASNRRTWEAGVFYQSLDKDALYAQLVDSDFGNGNTDTEGWVFKGGYAPAKNWVINATYFLNTLNKDVGTELDYQRLQLDLNYKF
jgi:hypothetical protein